MMRKTVHTPASIFKVFFVNTVKEPWFNDMLEKGEFPNKLIRTWQSLGKPFSRHECYFVMTAMMLRHQYVYTSKRLTESLTSFQASELNGQSAAIRQ
jgi:hypothetical protein